MSTSKKITKNSSRRESPQDFMLAFLKWKKRNPKRCVTPKGFAIIRGERKSGDK